MWAWGPLLQARGVREVVLRRPPSALLGRTRTVSESKIAARRAWVRSPHCAFRSYTEDGKQRFGLVARTFSVDHLEMDARVTIAWREENLEPFSDVVRRTLRQDAITTRAVQAMPGIGFADFLASVS
jgi:hypothetical protein